MKTYTTTGLAALLTVCLAAQAMLADTASEMLEKGIYNEETIGNLDAAIKIYREVVAAAGKTERLAADAQFRLAQCLLKQKKKVEAIRAFKQLVTKFPDQKDLVAKAKQYLPDSLQALNKAPWKDGERLTLTMTLPGGQTLGLVGLGVDAGQFQGKDVWQMSIRRFVAAGQNEGVSTVTVDRASNRPVRTGWDHMMLGTANAEWGEKDIKLASRAIGGKPVNKTIEMEEPAYSNDQWFFGFRQLPLAIGYKVTIPIRVAFTGGNAINLELEVNKKETMTTPVGKFDCFRLDTNISQTLWVADVPERYLVKFLAGGVEANLSAISNGQDQQEIENDHLDFSMAVPKGWFYQPLETSNEDNAAAYRLVAPTMASVVLSVKNASLLDDDDRASLDSWAESKLARGKRSFKDYTLRPESLRDTQLAGVAAKQYVIDHKTSGPDFTRSVVLAIAQSKAVALALTTKKSDFSKYEPTFASLLESFQGKE